MAFEQLMAEATAKREKKEEKKEEKKDSKTHRHMFSSNKEGRSSPTAA